MLFVHRIACNTIWISHKGSILSTFSRGSWWCQEFGFFYTCDLGKHNPAKDGIMWVWNSLRPQGQSELLQQMRTRAINISVGALPILQFNFYLLLPLGLWKDARLEWTLWGWIEIGVAGTKRWFSTCIYLCFYSYLYYFNKVLEKWLIPAPGREKYKMGLEHLAGNTMNDGTCQKDMEAGLQGLPLVKHGMTWASK